MKYKNKYLELRKNQKGGGDGDDSAAASGSGGSDTSDNKLKIKNIMEKFKETSIDIDSTLDSYLSILSFLEKMVNPNKYHFSGELNIDNIFDYKIMLSVVLENPEYFKDFDSNKQLIEPLILEKRKKKIEEVKNDLSIGEGGISEKVIGYVNGITYQNKDSLDSNIMDKIHDYINSIDDETYIRKYNIINEHEIIGFALSTLKENGIHVK